MSEMMKVYMTDAGPDGFACPECGEKLVHDMSMNDNFIKLDCPRCPGVGMDLEFGNSCKHSECDEFVPVEHEFCPSHSEVA